MPQKRTTSRASAGTIACLSTCLKTSVIPLMTKAWLWLRANLPNQEPANSRLIDQQQDDFEPTEDLKCCIDVGRGIENDQVFTVKLRGSIHTDQAGRKVNLKLWLNELDESRGRIIPVYQKNKPDGQSEPLAFEYTCELGRLGEKEKKIVEWLSVAKIKPDWMIFSRKGNRRINARVKLICLDNSDVYAQCETKFEFNNQQWGYFDIAENAERASALAVTVAFALCAAESKIYKCEIEKIKEWAYSHLQSTQSKSNQKQLARAMRKTIRFFKNGYKVNVGALCKELASIATLARRYDIIALCLKVVESKGFVCESQLKMLKDLVCWLEIDPERFREMLERTAPATTHLVKDNELIFGLTDELSNEEKRKLLNCEYKKWNSRVTNVNRQIQSQAEQMLNLIAQTRSEYLN